MPERPERPIILFGTPNRLLRSLESNTWGKDVRLEQERISFQDVKQFPSTL